MRLLLQVVFPLVLDLYEFCTEDHKKALEGPRKAWQEAEDKRAGLEKAAKAAAKSSAKDDVAQVAPNAPALTASPEHASAQCLAERFAAINIISWPSPAWKPAVSVRASGYFGWRCKAFWFCPVLNAPMCRQMVLTRLGRQKARTMPMAAKLTWR